MIKSVDDYIASQPDQVQIILKAVREAILTAIPDVEEAISYKMPAYKFRGAALLQFAAWKNHFSLYGATNNLPGALRDELASYKIEKGTIQFPLSGPVRTELIQQIAKFRASEIDTQNSNKSHVDYPVGSESQQA